VLARSTPVKKARTATRRFVLGWAGLSQRANSELRSWRGWSHGIGILCVSLLWLQVSSALLRLTKDFTDLDVPAKLAKLVRDEKDPMNFSFIITPDTGYWKVRIHLWCCGRLCDA
jgi:hypothetical protein